MLFFQMLFYQGRQWQPEAVFQPCPVTQITQCPSLTAGWLEGEIQMQAIKQI